MERDPFEEAFREKREALDHHKLPEDLWRKIEQESFDGKSQASRISFNYWKIAASILLVVSFGLTVRLLTLDNTPKKLGDISPIYEEIENSYLTQIETLEIRLDQPVEIKKELEWMFEELTVLDSIQKEYLSDLQSEQNREKVIGVLIDHYEKKIKLLRKLELEIQRKKHEKELPIS